MDRETFIKALEIVISKTNLPNGNGINLKSICKDFALLAYDEALILHNVVGQSEQLCVNCKKAKIDKGDICDGCIEMYKNF